MVTEPRASAPYDIVSRIGAGLDDGPDDQREGEHIDGCVKEHDTDRSECMTYEDYESIEADRKYDEMKDARFDD